MKDIITVNNAPKRTTKRRRWHLVCEIETRRDFGILGQTVPAKQYPEMMEALHDIDGGDVEIDGIDVAKHPMQIKNIIGIQLQATSFYDKLNLREQLKMFASLYEATVDADALLAKKSN